MDEELPSCLICSRTCSSAESLMEFTPGGTKAEEEEASNCPQLEAQMTVLFVLQKLLNLPEDTCAELISFDGNAGDTWSQAFCLICSGFIEEAQEVSYKIANYMEKFKCLQLKVQDNLRYSFDDNETNVSGKNTKLRSEIRKLCIQEMSTSNKTDKLTTTTSKVIRENSIKAVYSHADEGANSLSSIDLSTAITVKTECTFHNETALSPEPDLEGELNDDYLDPGSVVQVMSNQSNEIDETSGHITKRILRNRVTKVLEAETHSNSKDIEDSLTWAAKGKRDTKTKSSSKKEYKCPLCPKVLMSVNFLNLHYKKLHLGITSAKDKSRKVLKKNQKKCSTSNSRNKRGERKYPFKCPEPDCPQHFPSEYFRDAHHKRKHLGIHLPYQCDKCGKAYDRNACLVVHKKNCIGDGTFIFPEDPKLQETVKFKCPKCPRHFPSELFRDAHVKRLHQGVERPYNCYICDKAFQRHNGLSEHLKSVHQLSKMDSTVSKDLPSSTNGGSGDLNLSESSSPETDDDWFPPEVGDLNDSETSGSEDETHSISKKARLNIEDSSKGRENKHKRRQKSGTEKQIEPKKRRRQSILPIKQRARVTQIYRCTHEGCNKVFHLEVQRDGHVKQAHEGVLKPFKCDHEQCNKAYGRYSTLQIHKESSHGLNNDSFMCQTCGKLFYNPGAFKRHVYYVHDKPKKKKAIDLNKHPCDECGKFFKGPSGLLRHKNAVHTAQLNVFKCSECDLEFPTKMQRSFHRRTQHLKSRGPLIPIKCPQCDKSFNGVYLKRHIKLAHKQEFKFICSVCNMGFGEKCSYDRHVITHTGEKPFTCDQCGKGLTRRGDLNRHMRLHTGEKPFTCEQCGQSFSDSSKLTKHQKTHGEPKYPCDVCPRKFYSFTKLRLHKIIHEPNHVGRVKRNVDPSAADRPKQNRPRKPKNSDNSKTKPEGTRRGRGRPRKIQTMDSDSDLDPQIAEEFNCSNSYSLDMQHSQDHDHVQSLSNYHLPASSTYNPVPALQQHVSAASGQQMAGAYRSGQPEYQLQGSQALGLLTQTYVDPNMYLYHLNQMNPPNNNS